MTAKTCRWGILGTANIAKKNWQSLRDCGNGTLVAVASRSTQRAQEFIDELQLCVPFKTAPLACTYEELLANPDIDAVYIPIPTGIRKDWVIKAANAGKHVLCEKPCAPNAIDLAEMIAACQTNNVQFMDGVMFMHSQRLDRLRETLDDGRSIGTLRRIATQFSFCGPEAFHQQNIRVSHELEPLGCLGDLGWYTIRFALWVMKYQMPERVVGRLLTATTDNVPLEFCAELFFANGVSVAFYNSFITENQQWGHLSGSKGHLLVPDFVIPYFGCEVAFTVTNSEFHATGCQFDIEDHTRRIAIREHSNNAPDAQETKMFRTFNNLVLSGQHDQKWADIALQTQQVMDACVKSAGQDGAPVSMG